MVTDLLTEKRPLVREAFHLNIVHIFLCEVRCEKTVYDDSACFEVSLIFAFRVYV